MDRSCSDVTCVPGGLCPRCYGRELMAKRGQAAVIGQCWAERIGLRHEELRAQPVWPEHEERTLAIARRLVRQLTQDPRLIDELAAACNAGAAAWWLRRPERYRG